MPSDVVVFVADPSGTLCSSVFWLPATRLSGAVSLSPGWLTRRSQPSEEEALLGAQGCQWATRCGMVPMASECRISRQCRGVLGVAEWATRPWESGAVVSDNGMASRYEIYPRLERD